MGLLLNLEKLINDERFQQYKLHTLSDVHPEQIGDRNIFVYTPERFLSYIEKPNQLKQFDFIFIDEVYKIDNEYIIDEEIKESERDVSYRIAAFYSLIKTSDILMAGPYIEEYSESFKRFMNDNGIETIDFNRLEIVGKTTATINKRKIVNIDPLLTVNFGANNTKKIGRLKKLLSEIWGAKENCLIYCATIPKTEEYARQLLNLDQASIEEHADKPSYESFMKHVKAEFGSEWIVTQALGNKIGVHHSSIPKYMQKEIIRFFNSGILKAITSTTTITEGVNTSAKNLIIMNNKKGNKPLKRFDAKNIAGRAGRFEQHYSGRVIALQNDFEKDLSKDSEKIKHKNYDPDSPKDEIDLFYSKDEFLNADDLLAKESIIADQNARNIPDHIFDMYKVVSRRDKIIVYDHIRALNASQRQSLRDLISSINIPNNISINWDGFQVILECLASIITNPALNGLVSRKTNNDTGEHSVLTVMVHNYLDHGFKGLIEYKISNQGKSVDIAIREASRFVYNTLKYQLVKYLGVFNIMYKFHRSQNSELSFDEVTGIDKLLTKLEYNAVTELGRHASDYGVPDKVLKYYENDRSEYIYKQFDEYEMSVFDRVDKILRSDQQS